MINESSERQYIVVGKTKIEATVCANEDTGECYLLLCDSNHFDIGTIVDTEELFPIKNLASSIQQQILTDIQE